MSVKKLIIVLVLIFLSSPNAYAVNIKVRFLNGIQNNPDSIGHSVSTLKKAYQLYKTSDMPKLDSVAKLTYSNSVLVIEGYNSFDSYKNTEDTLILGDFIELGIQGTITGLASDYAKTEHDLQVAKAKAKGVTLTDDTKTKLYNNIYKRTLSDYYSYYLTASNSTGRINIKGVISSILEQIRSDLGDGSSIVIVSHSQGNFFAEAINSQLTASEKNRVRFVGVASVASTTPNDRYVSFYTDLAVFGAYNGLRLLAAPLGSPPLPATNVGYYAGPEGISNYWDAFLDIVNPSSIGSCINRTINCPSAVGHSFTDVYMNNSVVNSGSDVTPIAARIVGMIGESITELNQLATTYSVSPSTATIGTEVTFTVTGNNLTDGMGFAVQDCSPSSNELPGGTATKRQFRCTLSATPGIKTGVLKNAPGGTTLYNFTVTVNDAPTTSSSCTSLPAKVLFTDSFKTLDNNKWYTNSYTNGIVTLGNDGISISGASGKGFPLIQTVNNPFPVTGNFSLYCQSKINSFNQGSVGSCVASDFIDTKANSNSNNVYIGGNGNYGSYIGIGINNDSLQEVYHSDIGNNFSTHSYEVCFIGSDVSVYRDGQWIGTNSLPSNWKRPKHLWIGSDFSYQNPVMWSSFTTSKIEVRQLP